MDKITIPVQNTDDISDGYHTFGELYKMRMLYNACLFNEWAKQGLNNVHKSVRHNDGDLCFGGGWFIVVATLETGNISNHYSMEYWHLFNVTSYDVCQCPFDGHTQFDVMERLEDLCIKKKCSDE